MTLDTRDKILTVDQAGDVAHGCRKRGESVVAFVSHLEVLRAAHARKLEDTAATHPGKLFVIITEPDAPLVPLPARVEVAAGLRVVDYVVPAPGGASAVLAAIEPDVRVDDEQEDRVRTRQLMDHVRSRSGN